MNDNEMNKAYFITLANYNIWANGIVQQFLYTITQQQWQQPIVSSFESIEGTALHITGAETMWLSRLNQETAPVWLPSVFKGTKQDMLKLWTEASEQLKTYIQQFDEANLSDSISFKRITGEENTMKYYEIWAHVFNHSTYHRGQLITMLRQVGFTAVSSTDLLTYFRNNK